MTVFSVMVRCVEREGRVVMLTNMVGPYVGRPSEYRFPTTKMAEEFEAFAGGVDGKGCPVAIGEEWHRYKVHG